MIRSNGSRVHFSLTAIAIRDENDELHYLQSQKINHPYMQIQAYSFDVPFISHLVRLAPGHVQVTQPAQVRHLPNGRGDSMKTWSSGDNKAKG